MRADADIELAADLLVGAYAWNYRLAAAGRAQAAQLTALFDRQVGLDLRRLSGRRMIALDAA